MVQRDLGQFIASHGSPQQFEGLKTLLCLLWAPVHVHIFTHKHDTHKMMATEVTSVDFSKG